MKFNLRVLYLVIYSWKSIFNANVLRWFPIWITFNVKRFSENGEFYFIHFDGFIPLKFIFNDVRPNGCDWLLESETMANLFWLKFAYWIRIRICYFKIRGVHWMYKIHIFRLQIAKHQKHKNKKWHYAGWARSIHIIFFLLPTNILNHIFFFFV